MKKPILRCGGIDENGLRAECENYQRRLVAIADLRGPGIPTVHWMAPPMLVQDEPCTEKAAA